MSFCHCLMVSLSKIVVINSKPMRNGIGKKKKTKRWENPNYIIIACKGEKGVKWSDLRHWTAASYHRRFGYLFFFHILSTYEFWAKINQSRWRQFGVITLDYCLFVCQKSFYLEFFKIIWHTGYFPVSALRKRYLFLDLYCYMTYSASSPILIAFNLSLWVCLSDSSLSLK